MNAIGYVNVMVTMIPFRFSSKELNVLIATNVLEEGIDVSACNVVISYDFPIKFASYIQSRGRARNKDSVYYIFSNKEKNNQDLDMFQEIKTELESVLNSHSALIYN